MWELQVELPPALEWEPAALREQLAVREETPAAVLVTEQAMRVQQVRTPELVEPVVTVQPVQVLALQVQVQQAQVLQAQVQLAQVLEHLAQALHLPQEWELPGRQPAGRQQAVLPPWVPDLPQAELELELRAQLQAPTLPV